MSYFRGNECCAVLFGNKDDEKLRGDFGEKKRKFGVDVVMSFEVSIRKAFEGFLRVFCRKNMKISTLRRQ